MPRTNKPTTDIFPDKDAQGLDPYTVIVTSLNAIKASQEKLDQRFDEIYDQFKEIPKNYATKQELTETKGEIQEDIDAVRSDWKQDISGIHDWIKWATRAVVAAVLAAVVAWVLSGGLVS